MTAGETPAPQVAIRKVRTMKHRVCLLPVAVLTLVALANIATACLVCYRPPYQCLLEKVESSQQVIVARTIDETQSAWRGKVVRVINGEVDVDQVVTVNNSKSDRMTVGELQLLRRSTLDEAWSIECPIDRDLLGFLAVTAQSSSHTLSNNSARDQSQTLRRLLPYLEHSHPQIADSAYTKIAKAPYEVVRRLGTDFEPEQLLAWIESQNVTQKRKALYITLLGACGGQRESTLLKKWIDEGWERQDTHNLAALLTAHAELNGEATIRLIEKSYIQNRERKLGELIAAVNALRVHGQTDRKVSRSRVLASFFLLLRERPALLEMIIEDCARWKDWRFAPKLMEIYASGKQPWNNAMIIKYLESCPLPSAKQFVERVSG